MYSDSTWTGQTGQTYRLDRSAPAESATSSKTGQTALSDRSDRLMSILAINKCSPIFFGKACLPKNILLSQSYLRAMINITSAIFCAKGDKKYRPCLAFLQVDDESICFGLQTFFMTIGFVGLTSTSCPIVSCLRKRCNLRI